MASQPRFPQPAELAPCPSHRPVVHASRSPRPPLSSAAPATLKAATTYRLAGALEGWTVGGSVLAQSALTAEGVGWLSGIPYAIRQPGVAVFDAMTRYQLRDDTEIQLNVTNLFDRTWYSSIGDSGSGNWLAQPRTVSLTLRHTF